ncbi:CocE/NonD family hydrolase [Nocardioides sp. GY 10127]|uniref:CocE/NonD family hydrolase n=1 Tax=Nocardioides sp. GY 10127 TaxID=2569762 RepID=UPI0010A7C264|nr:CocE/NonD family hydrolase [Nocardioides sp. GY 10127]TIC81750.1 CocE/NonD family hydrolase [Nocardioides sp. GY 10127]
MTQDTTSTRAPGWSRPPLPPEGEAHFLEDHPFDLVRTPLPESVLVEEARITMRDGVVLAATVFRPADGSVVPVLATSTPYGKDDYGQWDHFRDAPEGNVPGGGFYLGQVTVSDHTPFEAPDPGYWVPEGYAVLLVDHPGLGRSDSNPSSGLGIEERWRDVMAWVEEQEWSTGKVGMSGVSALCAVQWMAAMDPAPPQLKAIIPWEGINESGPAGGYGGIPEVAFPEWLGHVWIGPNVNPEAQGPEPALFDWAYDVSRISVPALVCASFSDQELHSWDTFHAFGRMQSEHKWLYNHRRQKWGAYYGAPELALQKAFLDRFLKDDETAFTDQPRVRLEVNESRDVHKVLTAQEWPLPETVYETWHLDAREGLLAAAEPSTPAAVTIAPAPVDDTDNRAVFDLTFTEDTDLVGHMVLHLAVEAVGTTDVDLFVGVEKLDAQGDEVYFYSASGGNANGPVTRGWLRASKRTLDEARSTAWRPVLDLSTDAPLTPGEITDVTIPLMPSGTTFRAGETLRLVVQSWSTPGQWEGGECRVWAAHQEGSARLHTGPGLGARLVVPRLG